MYHVYIVSFSLSKFYAYIKISRHDITEILFVEIKHHQP